MEKSPTSRLSSKHSTSQFCRSSLPSSPKPAPGFLAHFSSGTARTCAAAMLQVCCRHKACPRS
ncbi:hypothetical protein BC567DRAFT_215675 [Phyllosticta citribraziliensis]